MKLINRIESVWVAILHDIWELFLHFSYPLYKKEQSPRVFCLGCGKTGTTTLNKCLSILGYRTFHWLRHGVEPRGGWIEYIKGRNFDALSDDPLCRPGMYKKLDENFKGSKFILTLRDRESWAKSFANFHKNSKLAPGNRAEIERLAGEYEAYNREVREYFSERPNDLLEINIFAGDDWKKLCDFLEKPVPNKPFPHKQKGTYKR